MKRVSLLIWLKSFCLVMNGFYIQHIRHNYEFVF